MNDLIPYQQQVPTPYGFNAKKTITLTLLGGATLCGIYWYVKKQIDHTKENKSDAKSFQGGAPATIATELNLALTTGTLGPNVQGLRDTLLSVKSKEDLDQIKKEYLNQYHTDLNAAIKSKVKLSEYTELVAISDAKPNKGKAITSQQKYELWAIRIKAAFDKKNWLGIETVDLEGLAAVLKEIPTQIAFINVGKAYYKLYLDNVMTVLKSKLHFWEEDTYMKLLTDKPKGK